MKDPSKILLVEDDEIDRRKATIYLKEYNEDISLTTSSTGTDGLRLISEEQFDCLLLDFNLPDMDAVGFLERLKGSDLMLPIPVVVLTSVNDINKVIKVIKLGALDFITKDASDLSAQLKSRILVATTEWAIQKTITGLEAGVFLLEDDLQKKEILERISAMTNQVKELRGNYYKLLEKYSSAVISNANFANSNAQITNRLLHYETIIKSLRSEIKDVWKFE